MKANEATLNRPGGERVLDASYVISNIDDRIKQLKKEEAWDKSDRNAITLVKNDQMTIVLVCLHKGADIAENTVDGMITLEVIEGRVTVTTGTETLELCEHALITFRPNIGHSVHADKESAVLLTTCGV